MPGASVHEQDAITKNITVAYEKRGYKKDGPVYTMFERWAHRFPLLPLQLLFLLCWYLLWMIPFFGSRVRPLLLYGVLLIVFCALVLIGNLLYTNYHLYVCRRGQVVRESVHLFAGPHDQYHVVGTVSLADELRIDAKKAGWYKVARGDQYGWIPAVAIELI